MKILHILDERWDSALTAYGLFLAEAQQKAGQDVFIAARPGRYAFETAKAKSIHVVPLSNPVSLRSWVARSAIDVVNAHTGAGHTMGLIAVLGCSTVLVRTRGEAREIRRNVLHAPLYRRTDAVIAASARIADQYLSAFPSVKSKLWVVYPGLDVKSYEPEPAGRLRFALVARLDPVKGQEVFLDALGLIKHELKDEEFVITGDEKNTPLKKIYDKVEALGLQHWVRITGRQEEIGPFMLSCHAGVITSTGSEALSRVCLEWMAAGRPVLASAVGCLPELVSTGENGFLVPPRSPDVLGKALLKLIRDANMRRAMGKRAHEIAAERFNAGRFVRETQKIYEKAIDARHSS